MPTANWDDLFETAGNVDDTPVPPSTYLCEVETAEWGETAKGKPMLKIRLRIKGGPQKQKALFTNITISPENPMALQIGLRHLAALGLTKEVLTNTSQQEQEDHVVGRLVQCTTKLGKPYKGTVRAEVSDIKATDEQATTTSANTPPPVADKADSNTPPPAPFAS